MLWGKTRSWLARLGNLALHTLTRENKGRIGPADSRSTTPDIPLEVVRSIRERLRALLVPSGCQKHELIIGISLLHLCQKRSQSSIYLVMSNKELKDDCCLCAAHDYRILISTEAIIFFSACLGPAVHQDRHPCFAVFGSCTSSPRVQTARGAPCRLPCRSQAIGV